MNKIATNKDILQKVVDTKYLKYTGGIYDYKLPYTYSITCKGTYGSAYNPNTATEKDYIYAYTHGLKNASTNSINMYKYMYTQLYLNNIMFDGTYIKATVVTAKSSHTTGGTNTVSFVPVHEKGKASNLSTEKIVARDTLLIPLTCIVFSGETVKINIYNDYTILQKTSENQTNPRTIVLSSMNNATVSTNLTAQVRIGASFKTEIPLTKRTNAKYTQYQATYTQGGSQYKTDRTNTASNRKENESTSVKTAYKYIDIPKCVIKSDYGVIDLGYFYNDFYFKIESGGTSRGANLSSKLSTTLNISFYEFIDTDKAYILSPLPVQTYSKVVTSSQSNTYDPSSVTYYYRLHYHRRGINLLQLLTDNVLTLQYNTSRKCIYIYYGTSCVGKILDNNMDYILACSINISLNESSASIASKTTRDTALGLYRSVVKHTMYASDLHNDIANATPQYSQIAYNFSVDSSNNITYNTIDYDFSISNVIPFESYGIVSSSLSNSDVYQTESITYTTQTVINLRSVYDTPTISQLLSKLIELTSISNIELKCPVSNVITPTYYNSNILLNKNIIFLSNYTPTTNKLVKLDSIYSRNFPLKFTIRILDQPYEDDRSQIVNMLEYEFTFNSVAYNSSNSSYDIKYDYTPELIFYDPTTFDPNMTEYEELNLDWFYFQGENLFIINSSDLRISTGNIPYRQANIIKTLDEEYDFYNYHSSDLKLSDISDNEILYAFTPR